MHYECELAVVIGATARATSGARTRPTIIAGYTVANDYAIRDYLENWYRPNLRVKNRDALHGAGAVARRRVPTCPTPRTSRCAPRSTAR